MNREKNVNKAILIGAGPSALVAAKGLAKKGWEVEIFEALDRVGGLCRSFQWNEYIVDIGPHVFHSSDIQLEKYWKKNFNDLPFYRINSPLSNYEYFVVEFRVKEGLYEINTPGDEIYYKEYGNRSFVASHREEGFGHLDIYVLIS